MKILPIVFNQNDPKWKFEPLGTSTVDIGLDGCYVTSDADCAVYFGKDTNPLRLNQIYTQNKIYENTDLLPDNALTDIYSDIVYQKTYHYETVPADLSQLQSLISDSTLFVIICIDRDGGNVHFSPVVDCDGKKVTIANPYDGQIEDFSQDYGDPKVNILKFVVYKGIPNNQTASNPSSNDQNVINAQKSVQFDESLTEFKNAGIISDDNSNNYINNDSSKNNGFLNLVKNLLTDDKSQRTRAGRYDLVCRYLGFTGDTNSFDETQVEKLIEEKVQQTIDVIGGKVKLPAGSSVDAVATAIVELQQDETNASTTANNLNGQMPELKTQLAEAQGKIKILTTQLETEGNVSKDPSSGISYQDLYNQLKTDYNTKKGIWEAQFSKDVAVFSQIKSSSIYFWSTMNIFSYYLQRITGQQKQNTPPPLNPSDFKYAQTVPPPKGT